MSDPRIDSDDVRLDVAPYRIVKRIGAGGMGEVFLATDDRLGRQVAIKRIRPDRDPNDQVQERFRREARFAASLTHPSIVQVHDILERDDALYVVMEWVEGENLHAHLQRRGPLPVPELVRIGHDLASALAAAHQRGIVHRDVKAENVLLETGGRIKLTDFGIAKRLPSGSGLTGTEEGLTADQAVIGTFRVLSPEHAQGQEVDHRSDLFSLGVLLYEAATGTSPFGSGNTLDTLRRIVEAEPEPVDALRPEIPRPLAQLVLRLLAKHPSLRPRSAREVELELAEIATDTVDDEVTLDAGSQPPPPPANTAAAAAEASATGAAPAAGRARATWPWFAGFVIIALVTLGWFVDRLPSRGADDPPLYVAVLDPSVILETASQDAPASTEARTFAEAVRVAIVRTLIDLERISAKTADRNQASDVDTRAIARVLGTEEVMTASILLRPALARVTLERVRAADGVVLWNESFETQTEDLFLGVRAITGIVRAAYPEHAPRRSVPEIDVAPEDLRRFLALRHRFGERLDPAGDILGALQALRTDAPDFVDIDLQIAEVALHRFYDSREPDHLEQAEQAIQRAERLAPADPRVLRFRVHIEIEAARWGPASSALDRLAASTPGDLVVEDLRVRLLQREGRATEALTLQRRIVGLQPSVRRLIQLAHMDLEAGATEAARNGLESAIQRSPDDARALSLLAQLELTVGDPERAVELYDRLLQRSAGTSELSNLGLAHLLLGRADRALASFDQVVEIEPGNPFFQLNRADALWLSGRQDQARDTYRLVIELIQRDDTADHPQFLTVEAQAWAHLGETRRAVSTIQRALARAPDSSSVAYEAALVFAVTGEVTSALVQADAAIDRGIDPRWFAFPWFDTLSGNEDFRQLLRKPGD